MSLHGRICALGLWVMLCGCHGERPRAVEPPRPADRWHYDVTIDQPLEHADVRVCFEGSRPDQLRAGRDEAAIFLESAKWASPAPSRKLPVRGGKVQLAGLPTEGCVRYGVDLGRARGQGRGLARRFGDDLLASPALWLWRPERRAPHARATLALHVPEGVEASVPWRRAGGVYELDARDFRYRAFAAFGTLSPLHLEQDGTRVEAVTVGPALPLDRRAMERWLSRVVSAVSDVLGHFPTPRVQIIAVDVGPSQAPIRLGIVQRGGGASVLLEVSSRATAETLMADWVLPHELSHLLLPYVEQQDAWLPEGLATYYQEVLRARAALKSEEAAWGALLRSMRKARRQGTGRDLAQESAAMHRTYAYTRVYWAGAALALAMDARLRHDSDGTRSLDTAIAQAPWWDEPPRTWRASEVLAALDGAARTTLFTETCAPALRSDDFPTVEALFDQLGVREEAGHIELSDDAPWAAVRRAIMSPRADRAAR